MYMYMYMYIEYSSECLYHPIPIHVHLRIPINIHVHLRIPIKIQLYHISYLVNMSLYICVCVCEYICILHNYMYNIYIYISLSPLKFTPGGRGPYLVAVNLGDWKTLQHEWEQVVFFSSSPTFCREVYFAQISGFHPILNMSLACMLEPWSPKKELSLRGQPILFARKLAHWYLLPFFLQCWLEALIPSPFCPRVVLENQIDSDKWHGVAFWDLNSCNSALQALQEVCSQQPKSLRSTNFLQNDSLNQQSDSLQNQWPQPNQAFKLHF